jgi:hypothetical protein
MAGEKWDKVESKATRAKTNLKKVVNKNAPEEKQKTKICRVGEDSHAKAKADAATLRMSMQEYLEKLIEKGYTKEA